MALVSSLTSAGNHFITGEYDEYTISNNSYAVQFNGSSQYLSLASNTAFDQNGAFTFECWVYKTSSSGSGYFMAQLYPGYLCLAYDSNLNFVVDKSSVGNQIISINTFAINTWHHVAMACDGTTTRLFVNGTLQGSAATTGSASGATLTIGRYLTGTNYFPGYISNVRFVKGTSVYTSNFNPPISPLTAITNTSLLTCQNQTIIDNSTNAFTITNSGGVTTRPPINFLSLKQKQLSNGDLDIIGEFDEYTLQNNSYATQFNGSSQYLTTATASISSYDFSNGNYTIEFWMNPSTITTETAILCAGPTTGGALNRGWGLELHNGTSAGLWFYQAGVITSWTNLGSYTSNVWQHVAIVRNGTTVTAYVNGISVGSASSGTSTQTAFSAGDIFYIGALHNTGNVGRFFYPGYISNVRIIKGTSVYTSNFNPPTSPLTNITNTSLLTCQNPTIIDNSTNAFTITNNGTATTSKVTSGASFILSKQKQFSNGDFNIAGKFDEYTMTNGVYSVSFSGASGEYLTIPSGVLVFGTNNFTVEAWIYTTAYNISGNGGEVIIDNYMSQTSGSYSVGQWTLWINTSGQLSFNYTSSTTVAVAITGTTVTPFAWNHVAVVRNGTTITLYLNGASVASGTYAGTIGATGTSYIGGQAAGSGLTYRYAGSISNLRVLNSTALYTTNFTVPTRPLTINSNTTAAFPILPTTNTTLLTCQLPYMEDNSTNGYIIGNPASLTPSIVPNKFYSAFFDGGFINTMIQTPNDARYNVFGVSASTIEFYYYSRSTRAGHLCIVGIGNQDRAYIISNGASLTVGTAIAGIYNTRITAPTSIVQYKWYHVALTRVGTTVSLYLDGVLQGSSTASFYSNAGGVTVTFGTQPYGGGSSNDWYIGLMSNIRILNGTALYTGNFTPPTNRLTAITNTVLLTLVSSAGIVDETGLATLSNPRALPYNAALF